MRKQFAVAVLAASFALASGPASAYTTLFAFGDSLSDAGNLFALKGIPSAPYVDHHFSNGPTWVEDLSEDLGLGALKPSASRGTDFAVGGATTGGDLPIDLDYQVAEFEAYAAAAKLTAKTINGALFTLDIGANDTLSDPATAMTVVTDAANSAAAEVAQLHDKDGARNLLFYEVPNLGLTPDAMAQGPAAKAAASMLALLFNKTVLDDLAPLETGADPLNLFALNMFDELSDVVADPSRYRFTDVTDPCWTGNFAGSGGTLCSTDPDKQNKFLFWDGLHPTKRGHMITADLAYALVAPEPSTWAMILIGSAGLGLAGWRAQRSRAASARA